MSTYTAVVKQDGDWWIGWVEEVSGVNAQESTREGLVASLKVVLQEALEMNRAGSVKRRDLLRKICTDLGIPRP